MIENQYIYQLYINYYSLIDSWLYDGLWLGYYYFLKSCGFDM